ncbi:GNAT family N-acetyltransferase [Streptococcus phocae]|uniref:GNAT family acetyltransferase n=1 Tax=Streptococcus phocae TaxID=119224 RepID=A0A0P6SNQ0_9STRE|nr:GNAT family N-acetyltransferase [Streptococcus phocae]KPJ23063.1 GNAT family acetyltransferase [Streptococcus phocae]
MRIRRPLPQDEAAVMAMIEEFLAHDSKTDGLWNFQAGQMTYMEWLDANRVQEMGLAKELTPAIQCVAFDDDQQALGFLSLRLRLTDSLLQKGGHIGYSVRPTKRGQGLAKEMLKQALALAKTKNIHKALVTCDQTNLASRSVILANGGILEDVRGGCERYWIET